MATVASSPGEQRMVLRVGWETYERILADHANRSVPRFAYDRGLLEIISPVTELEETNRTLATLVEVVAEELGIDTRNVGSMAFKREDLRRGIEPDSCFYVRNEERVRGRRQIDLAVDPPPDLVIEVDVTSPSLPRLPIYAAMGVPEIWRFDADEERVIVLTLGVDGYGEASASAALPLLTGEALSRFVAESRALPRTGWLRTVRGWVREAGATG